MPTGASGDAMHEVSQLVSMASQLRVVNPHLAHECAPFTAHDRSLCCTCSLY